jgi:predicted  nucleic acid-binding Zn-ribbon protein
MGFGDTAKKIQTLADKAERTYQKINELRTEVEETQTTVLDTSERVQRLENEMAEQRAVLDAVAEEVGVDLESVSTEAHITDAEEAAAADDTDDAENGDAENGDAEAGADGPADGAGK